MLHRDTNKNFNRLPLCQFQSASHDERNTAACSFIKDSVSIIKTNGSSIQIRPDPAREQTVIQSNHEGKIYAAAALACR